MSRQKILFLAESLSVGGAEKALISILKQLDYSKFEVTLLLISQSGSFLKEAKQIDGLIVRYIVKPALSPLGSLLNRLKIKAIYKWLPANFVGNYLCKGHDVVIAFCEGYLTKWVGASKVSCRKIAWVHTDMLSNDWPIKTGVFHNLREEIRSYHNFDEVVAVSETVAKGIKSKFGYASPVVIYNILDCEIIKKSQTSLSNIRRAKLNIVSVGRLEHVKGFDQLIDAIDILVNQNHFDIHLCLVGDGSQRAIIEQKISNTKLHKNITLAGMQSNPYPYVAAADIFVCPSRQEGFNIAILEAMTLGKPIISTNCAGPSEILGHGEFGLLVENSVQSLVDGIKCMYTNSAELTRLSKLSIARAKHYNVGSQLATINKILA